MINKKKSVKVENPASIDYLKEPVTRNEKKARKSMDLTNKYLFNLQAGK